MKVIVASSFLLASLGTGLFTRARAAEVPAPNIVTVAAITEDCQKLEGIDNQGTATVELEATGITISGAVAMPFAVGDARASVSAHVRLRMPEKGTSPEFGSAMLGLYGQNVSQRLMAFIAFPA
jgi:hypothetical protein